MKTLIVGDLHLMKTWPHADLFDDLRITERKAIYEMIWKAAKECDRVVLGGDVLDKRDNPASVYKDLVAFLEGFGDKEVYVMSGNHQSSADGSCAEDFIREIKDKPWHVVNGEIKYLVGGLCLIPYFRKQQLGVQTDKEVVDRILNMLEDAKMTVIHHAISGTKTESGALTDLFHEAVLPADELLKRSGRVAGCHIHLPQDKGRLQIVGSVMNQDFGETHDKRVLIWDTETDKCTTVPLPGRKLMVLRNPTLDMVKAPLLDGDIVKVITSDPEVIAELEGRKGFIVQEAPKSQRQKSGIEVDAFDFSIPTLLEAYAEENGIEKGRLAKAFAKVE